MDLRGPMDEGQPRNPEKTDYDRKMNSQPTDNARAFRLAPALAAERLAFAEMALCQGILRDERRYPWVVLVPRRAGLEEVFDLLPGDSQRLWREVSTVASALKAVTECDKTNIAAFGNVTRQLHVHIVARSEGDPHWAGGAVGVDDRVPYSSGDLGDGGVPAWWPALLARLALRDLTRP